MSNLRRRPEIIASLPGEVWRVVAEAPEYEVSDLGRIRRLTDSRGGKAETGVRGFVSSNGYLMVNLCTGGRRLTRTVHRIVCVAFVGQPADGMDVCHNDCDRLNNRAANLRIDSRAGNMADSTRLGRHNRGERGGSNKLPQSTAAAIKLRLLQGARNCEITREFNVAESYVRNIKRGHTWAWLEVKNAAA